MITAMYNSREQVRRVSWKQPTLPSLLPLKHSWMKIICKFLMQKPLFLNGHIYSLFTLSFQAFSKWTPQVLTVRRSSSRGKESAGPQLLSLLLWNPATSFPGTCPDSYRPLTTSLSKQWNIEILSDDCSRFSILQAGNGTCHHPAGPSVHSWARFLSPLHWVQGSR